MRIYKRIKADNGRTHMVRILGKFLIIQWWNYGENNKGMWFRLFGKGCVFSTQQLFSDRHFKKRRYFGYYIRNILT